jgi:transposase-like protein
MLDEKTDLNALVMSGNIQCDETFIGGKRKNMHGRKRAEMKLKYGAAGTADKYPVFGMIQEGGKLVMMPVSSTEAETLEPIIQQIVVPGSTVVTDTNRTYFSLDSTYNHQTVVHSIGNYVNEDKYHTNLIESVWAILKRGYVGTYHYMSPKHLNRYCVEFAYRFNTKGITDCARFEDALKNPTGRLKYKDLIAA